MQHITDVTEGKGRGRGVVCDEMVQHITDVTEGKRRGGEGCVR